MIHGFLRIATAVPQLTLADCPRNAEEILALWRQAHEEKASLVVFPELCLTGYTCGDLFRQETLLQSALIALQGLLEASRTFETLAVIGMPLLHEGRLFNVALVLHRGQILGVVPKSHIPNNNEFYEKRWFTPARELKSRSLSILGHEVPIGADLLFHDPSFPLLCFGIEICEDMWVPLSPHTHHCVNGATLILNLSASNEVLGKHEYRLNLLRAISGKNICAYAYASAGMFESSTDLVFGGFSAILENGSLLTTGERFAHSSQIHYADVDLQRIQHERIQNSCFSESSASDHRKIEFQLAQEESFALRRVIDPRPFVPQSQAERAARCSEIFQIQTTALYRRLLHTHTQKVVLGISGGLDSTLALLVVADVFQKLGLPSENILTITMPGWGTSETTYSNAHALMKALGTSIREIDIKAACLQHFADIGHDPSVHDITYENTQARERTQILMDIANQHNALVIGTGDLSELVLGWCTYNGDHMSMYAVNVSIPKTLVQSLILWYSERSAPSETSQVLQSILQTPISPELLPPDPEGKIQQKTEDLVGPYELHDFFIYYALRFGMGPQKILFLAQHAFGEHYSQETLHKWLGVFYRRFFSQQFKRSCLPDGPKVGSVSISPRGDWRMPSDASARIWIEGLNKS